MSIRKQTFSLEQYLKSIKDETIRTDQECQRLSGQWDCNMVNELIYTVLTNNYIPPIILGEETQKGITKQWIIDGLQRSSSLSMFRYGNTKITKSLDEPVVTYQRKAINAKGEPQRDDKGEIIWEIAEFDIRNKSYNQFPEELKKVFNEYQIETVIHQNCDTTEISKLVRKYNNHRAMNAAQKAFTYIDGFAREIRDITENKFFRDLYVCKRNDRTNGTLERVVGDMILLCFYPEQYKKDTKKGFMWLNENAALYDFETLNKMLVRLAEVLDGNVKIKDLFGSKNATIFVAAFREFEKMGRQAMEYNTFLNWFLENGCKLEFEGQTWNEVDADRSTRDLAPIKRKIAYLVEVMKQYVAEKEKAA